MLWRGMEEVKNLCPREYVTAEGRKVEDSERRSNRSLAIKKSAKGERSERTALNPGTPIFRVRKKAQQYCLPGGVRKPELGTGWHCFLACQRRPQQNRKESQTKKKRVGRKEERCSRTGFLKKKKNTQKNGQRWTGEVGGQKTDVKFGAW